MTWTPTLSQYLIVERKRGTSSETVRENPKDAAHTPAAANLTDSASIDDTINNDAMNAADQLLAAEVASLGGRFRKVIDFYEHWLRFALERPAWIAIFGVLLVTLLSSACGCARIYRFRNSSGGR